MSAIKGRGNMKGTPVQKGATNAATDVPQIRIKEIEIDIRGIILHIFHIDTETERGIEKETGIGKEGKPNKMKENLWLPKM